jgi:hypothetical protein
MLDSELVNIFMFSRVNSSLLYKTTFDSSQSCSTYCLMDMLTIYDHYLRFSTQDHMKNIFSRLSYRVRVGVIPRQKNDPSDHDDKGVYVAINDFYMILCLSSPRNNSRCASKSCNPLLNLTNIPRITNRRRPTHTPPHATHDNNHQPQPAQHTRQSIQISTPPPQPIDLPHPRANRRQAPTETVLNALQNLAPNKPTPH